MSTDDAYARTRRALHGVAELLLAGPQFRTSGTIRLRVAPGGFGTIKDPQLRVRDGRLISSHHDLPIAGATCATLAKAAGLDVGAPADLYHDNSGVHPDDILHVDANAAELLVAALAAGETALAAFAGDQPPVLWPEHFDLGITVDEVNYGVSPGDGYLAEPYAYVGPWRTREGEFWNAPFGAARPLRVLADTQAVAAFFEAGRSEAAR